MKRINEIFSDYEANGNINDCHCRIGSLKKKSKRLEMQISSDKYIEIKEFEGA